VELESGWGCGGGGEVIEKGKTKKILTSPGRVWRVLERREGCAHRPTKGKATAMNPWGVPQKKEKLTSQSREKLRAKKNINVASLSYSDKKDFGTTRPREVGGGINRKQINPRNLEIRRGNSPAHAGSFLPKGDG